MSNRNDLPDEVPALYVIMFIRDARPDSRRRCLMFLPTARGLTYDPRTDPRIATRMIMPELVGMMPLPNDAVALLPMFGEGIPYFVET